MPGHSSSDYSWVYTIPHEACLHQYDEFSELLPLYYPNGYKINKPCRNT
jgi:hypothetical protein